jgi:hypothetical protein
VGRKHKHEEHVNHERWLVSYADMVTLLFALFVVLYAMGVTELEKLKVLKKSIQFAFHIAGEGKTKDDGIFEKEKGAGDMPEPVPLINAQDGEMREFLSQVLPTEFEEVTGKSIEVVISDDTVSFKAPLAAFFAAGQSRPVKPEVVTWVSKAVLGSLSFTAGIRVRIEAPDLLLGEVRGRRLTSRDLCMDRLRVLADGLSQMPEVRTWMVDIEFAYQREWPAAPGGGGAGDWEQRAVVILAFSNKRNR